MAPSTRPKVVSVTLNPVLDRTLSVPRIEFDQVARATSVRLDWGGKGFNVARALQAMGEPCLAMGLIGGGTGKLLASGLDSLGITTDFVTIAGETRSNTVIQEEATGRYVKVNEAGPSVTPAELDALVTRISTLAMPESIWVVAGSLPPGAPDSCYARLVELLQGLGALVFLDTSGEPLRLGCAASPFLVKPNVEEATELTGCKIHGPKDALKAVAILLRQGVTIVALSMGPAGLVLASETQAVWARPPAVPARTPVGVGDALLAGMIWSMVRDYPLAEVARWGVAAGSASAMLAGVGVASMAEIEAIYQAVSLEVLRASPAALFDVPGARGELGADP